MERSTHPFPLAAGSSHHSHYHRFLLGADPAVLAPFPKPRCQGALAAQMPLLADALNLPRWRKLYHGAFPWVEGFGPEHYALGAVAPHCLLPRAYGRPARRFAAYDFVQIADPSVSALALVAGDARVLERFVALGVDFSARLEAGAGARAPGPTGSRTTGRMLCGQFVEPNNRWLMPFLHVHVRVLNVTSFAEAPRTLGCIDPGALARSGERANREWTARQAEALSGLGYRVAVRGTAPLQVDGVSPSLLAAMDAPRIAVLRLLERMVVGDRPPSAERLCAELPAEVIAAMAEQVEAVLARSLSCYKPRKIALPSEGPWRAAVREHLAHLCPGALSALDAAAARVGAVASASAVFPTPPLDLAHCHAPGVEALGAAPQTPVEPELGAWASAPAERTVSQWLAREFERTLAEVHERLVRPAPGDPLLRLRSVLATIDHLPRPADPDQVRQSALLIGGELERRSRQAEALAGPGRIDRPAAHSLEELLGAAQEPGRALARETGGRCL